MCLISTNQKEHIGAQPISVDFKFYNSPDVNVLDHTAFALVLTNRLISISSDGQKMFDINMRNKLFANATE